MLFGARQNSRNRGLAMLTLMDLYQCMMLKVILLLGTALILKLEILREMQSEYSGKNLAKRHWNLLIKNQRLLIFLRKTAIMYRMM